MPVDGRFTWWFRGEGAIGPSPPPCNGVIGRDGQAGGWIVPSSSGDWIDSPHPTAKYAKPLGYIPPHDPEGHEAVWGIGWR